MSPTLSLALAAGMVAAINPCAFSLLPAYVGWFVDINPNLSRRARVGRAIATAAAMTGGFVATFAAAGLFLETVADRVGSRLPWVTITIGAAVGATGLLAIAGGFSPRFKVPIPRAGRSRRPWNIAAFGAAYAVASLSCTIGPFLAVTSVATTASTGTATAAYLAYALGMGAVVAVVSAAAAASTTQPARVLRNVGRFAPRIGGLLMLLGGTYAVWYGRWELRVYDGDLDRDPIVSTIDGVRTSITRAVDRLGPAAALILAAAALLLLAGGVGRRTGRRVHPDDRSR